MSGQVLDVKGLQCPLPILRTRKMLDRMMAGDELTVEATDPASTIDFRHFCNVTDNVLLSFREENGVFIYLIRRGSMSVTE